MISNVFQDLGVMTNAFDWQLLQYFEGVFHNVSVKRALWKSFIEMKNREMSKLGIMKVKNSVPDGREGLTQRMYHMKTM